MVAEIILLTFLSPSNWLWMISLDSLIITSLLTVFLIVDFIRMEKALIRMENNQLNKQDVK